MPQSISEGTKKGHVFNRAAAAHDRVAAGKAEPGDDATIKRAADASQALRGNSNASFTSRLEKGGATAEEIAETRMKLAMQGSKTTKSNGTALTYEERERIDEEFPDRMGQDNRLVGEILSFLGRDECKGRAKDADDVFTSVKNYQGTRKRRSEPEATKARAGPRPAGKWPAQPDRLES